MSGETGPARSGDAAGTAGLPARPRKAPTAFRTISEVSDDLHIPQHVLRFWETKFPQLKPLKRGGGRRYYRPEDIALLRRISDLLYTQGYTIKGVQRLLREGGWDGATAGSPPLGAETPHGELPLGDAAASAALAAQADPATVALREALEALEAIAGELRALAKGGGGERSEA